MKPSEAIVLGSTLIKFDPSVFYVDGCGCLTGMMAAAQGIESERFMPPNLDGKFCPEFGFRWLQNWHQVFWNHLTYSTPQFLINDLASRIGSGIISFEEGLAVIKETIDPLQDIFDSQEHVQLMDSSIMTEALCAAK